MRIRKQALRSYSLRYGYTPIMGAVSVVFIFTAALIFGFVARFGDLPKLLGALRPEDR